MDTAKKNIKRCILKKFKTILETDRDILPSCWIADLVKRLNGYEKEFFYRAIEELIQAGIIEQVNSRGLERGLKLTHKGESLICY